jgi:hypothetical protein
MRTQFRWLGRVAAVALFMGPAGPVVFDAVAEDPPRDVAAQVEARQRREAAECRNRLARLQLTGIQARRLLPIIEKAADLHIRAYERQARLLPETVSAFAGFAAEDRLNQGFSKDVERRTGQINHQESEARDAHNKQLIALEEEAAKILTPQQRAAVPPPPPPGRRERPMLRTPLRARHPLGAQRSGNSQSEADRLAAARRELEALHAQKHPQLGPLGRCLLSPAAYEPVCQIAERKPAETVRRAIAVYERGTPELPFAQYEEQRAEVERLRKEINNWNLINGLHLDESQITRIVGLYDASIPSEKLALRQARPARPPETLLLSLEQAVEQVLNPGQRQVVADYKACLIPPKNLKDPVRVGQASDHSVYEQWLARARRQTGDGLERAISEGLGREAQILGDLSKTQRQQRAALLRKVVREAAAMSDAEFELSKAELAERIAPPDRAQELRKEIEGLARDRGLPGRVAHFMLNADFIAQLRQRGQQLAAGPDQKPADIAAGPQAENCDKGCALPGKKPKGPQK